MARKPTTVNDRPAIAANPPATFAPLVASVRCVEVLSGAPIPVGEVALKVTSMYGVTIYPLKVEHAHALGKALLGPTVIVPTI